jgi:EmrB/QacA subfamily drug resistance transporter
MIKTPQTISLTTSPKKTFAILLIGAFMALLDVTIVNVALPSIEHGINVSTSTLVWIVSGYALTFGLVLILSGRLGDRFGHKWTFLVGLSVFTLASLSCSLAQNSSDIIVSRLVQGIGAGFFSPAITSFIQILFTGKERSKAFGVYGAIVGLSTALGPLIGGLLIQAGGIHWGWRLVFLVNLPIGIITVPLAFLMLPETSDLGQKHNFDFIGLAILTIGLLLLLVPLVDGQSAGWPLWSFICLILAIPSFFLLWIWESHLDQLSKEPLITTRLLKQLHFAGGSLLAIVYFAAFTSIFFILSVLWQDGLNRSALTTGFMIVPFALGSMISASQSHKASAKLGRWVLVIGCFLVALGLFSLDIILHFHNTNIKAGYIALPLVIAGIGNGLVIAPNQDFVLKSVKPNEIGSASGLLTTSQRVGTALGIAAIGTVFFSSIHINSNHDLAQVFSHGDQVALIADTGLAITALVLVFLLPKKIPTE